MKISIVGTGYVGLVSGTCFAEMGNTVYCVDTDEKKIENLKKGIIPIYEPGLESMVVSNSETGSLHFTTDIKEALRATEIIFIAVGTPMGEDGSADLSHVLEVAGSIGEFMTHEMIVVDKSTVPVGTADKVTETIRQQLEKRGEEIPFQVVSNPEFLKEGNAIDDSMRPDRVVIGTSDEKALAIMEELYAPFLIKRPRVVAMDVRSAEMTKYAANSMLATKISFMNEMSRICERVGANVNNVRMGIGSDSRIGYSFIYPGCGYGGSCFPKDVQALIKTAKSYGYNPEILDAVESVNARQKQVLVDKIQARFGNDLSGMVFGLWGLAFKPGTDDMRAAPSIDVVRGLTKAGAKVKAYDPQAEGQAKEVYLKDVQGIEYVKSKYDAVDKADALVLVTEWKEFRSPDFDEVVKRMKTPIIFDGRNQYASPTLERYGIEYHQIGVQ